MKWRYLFITLATFLIAEAFFPSDFFQSSIAANIPATVIATPAVPVLFERSYRWYENVDGLDPVTGAAAEGVPIDAQTVNTQLRLRMNIGNIGGAIYPSGGMLTLQYANATSGPWTDVSTSTAWSFFDNPSVADGQVGMATLLGSSTVGESYSESNPSAAVPTQLIPGDFGEWDWSLVNISATTTANWFFRMINASGTALDSYGSYPKLMAVTPPPSGGGTPGGSSGGEILTGGGSGYLPPPATSMRARTSTPPFAQPLLPPAYQVVDFNGDNRIDIVDLSILLYYYHKNDMLALRHDLNHDKIVDFPDVSILMFYWTG